MYRFTQRIWFPHVDDRTSIVIFLQSFLQSQSVYFCIYLQHLLAYGIFYFKTASIRRHVENWQHKIKRFVAGDSNNSALIAELKTGLYWQSSQQQQQQQVLFAWLLIHTPYSKGTFAELKKKERNTKI